MAPPKGFGTKYKPEYCGLLIAYFERMANAEVRDLAETITTEEREQYFSPEELEEQRELDEANSKRKKQKKTGMLKRYLRSEVRRICAELPTIEGFAISIKTPSTTVKSWVKEYEDFGFAMARAKDIQRQLLIDRGLTRQYDPQAFQFVATNLTDMKAKQVIQGDPEAPIAARLILVDAGSDN